MNQQFDELNRLVRLEEWRVLHLVDLKEAFLTAQAAEKISEISVHTEKLQEEMDSVTQQLSELDQIEQNGVAPMSLAPLLAARPPRPPEALVEPMPLVSPFCTLFQSSFTERKKKRVIRSFYPKGHFIQGIHFLGIKHITLALLGQCSTV